MIEWKKICCAVDFADPSRVAMEQAADLAKRFEAELTLIHVRVPPLAAGSDVLVSSRTLASVQAREDEEMLARWRAYAERRSGRPTGSLVLWGDPAAEIMRHAREAPCDLLVVGTHGRTGLPRLVLGSVAERVARQSACPVLVVHDHGVVEKGELADEIAQYR
jgi:nucleotide-binding universal stress UspA family protein